MHVHRHVNYAEDASHNNSARLLTHYSASTSTLCLLQAGNESNQTDVKFELWRRVKGDVFERWEEQNCSLNPAKPPEPVSVETEDGTVIHGLRHRLQVHAVLSW